MSNETVQELLSRQAQLLEQIRVIEESCEGLENEENARKAAALNLERAKVKSEKDKLAAETGRLERQLQVLAASLDALSGKGLERLLEGIKEQRWFFLKNKPKVLLDRNTGYLWANLDYFPFGKDNNTQEYQPREAEALVHQLELDGFAEWVLPDYFDFKEMIEDRTFPFHEGDTWRIKENDYWRYKNGYTDLDQINRQDGNSRSGYIIPCCKALVSGDYKEHFKADNKVYNENERLRFALQLLVDNQLEPIFKDPALTELYRAVYVEKPLLLGQLQEVQIQLAALQQEVLLSAAFDYQSLLAAYDLPALEVSVVQYAAALQRWAQTLLDKVQHVEKVKGDAVRQGQLISLKLSRKYEAHPALTAEENDVLKERRQLFRKHFDIAMARVKSSLLSLQHQGEALEERLEELQQEGHPLAALAALEKEERPSFAFIAENTSSMVRQALHKIEYFEQHQEFAAAMIAQEEQWSNSYLTFKTALREQLQHSCEEESIEEERWALWYEDWRQKRLFLETRFLPLAARGLQGGLRQSADAEAALPGGKSAVESILALLGEYKQKLDEYYLEERKSTHQKFAFQPGGELQETFEVESALQQLGSAFQKQLQEILFALEQVGDRLFLLRWAEPLLDVAVDAILDFMKDKELSKIPQSVLEEFAALKQKNYEAFLSDVQTYSEELATREKQYNSLLYKMRKELMQ